MTTKMGIRELTRNISQLDKYDYIELEDKKTKEPKGMFISAKLAKELKDIIEQKAKEQREKKVNFIKKFAGFLEVEDRFKDKSYKEIREMIAKEKYGE
jgi:polyribonucleotide nucleotidyltransferase